LSSNGQHLSETTLNRARACTVCQNDGPNGTRIASQCAKRPAKSNDLENQTGEVLLVNRDQGVVTGNVVTLRDLAHLRFLLDATL